MRFLLTKNRRSSLIKTFSFLVVLIFQVVLLYHAGLLGSDDNKNANANDKKLNYFSTTNRKNSEKTIHNKSKPQNQNNNNDNDQKIYRLDELRSIEDFDILQRRTGNEKVPKHVPYSSCTRILLYDYSLFAGNGIGNQINTYIVAMIVASYLDRALVLLDPTDGSSQFGCFNKKKPTDSSYPSGLSRLMVTQSWMNWGCSVPCVDTYDYNYWTNYTKAHSKIVFCQDPEDNNKNISIKPMSGPYIRNFFISNIEKIVLSAENWLPRLGTTPKEIDWFKSRISKGNHSSWLHIDIEFWDQVSALLTRGSAITLQPWISRDVKKFVRNVQLPANYVGMHIRRGDKLFYESKDMVDQYWNGRGYFNKAKPKNYIPLSHYLKQIEDEDLETKTYVYIATDDQKTINEEIADLQGSNARFKFVLNPDTSSARHLHSDNDCSRKYERTIAAIADFFILTWSDIFVGEYNSNWGRLARTVRTNFVNDIIGTATPNDVRVAIGQVHPRSPGM